MIVSTCQINAVKLWLILILVTWGGDEINRRKGRMCRWDRIIGCGKLIFSNNNVRRIICSGVAFSSVNRTKLCDQNFLAGRYKAPDFSPPFSNPDFS